MIKNQEVKASLFTLIKNQEVKRSLFTWTPAIKRWAHSMGYLMGV